MVIDELKRRGELTSPILILSTLRIVQIVWPEEIRKWDQFSHISFSIIHGPKKSQRVNDRVDIHLVNNEGLAWLAKEGHLSKYRVLFVDESPKYKNPKATRTKILMGAVSQFTRRHCLTGTPAPKSYVDLFSQVYVADAGVSLGSKFHIFRRSYFYNLDEMLRRWVDLVHRSTPGSRRLTQWEIEDLADGYFPGMLDARKKKFLNAYYQSRFFAKVTNMRYQSDWRPRAGAKEEIERRIAHLCFRLNGEKLLTLPRLIENEIRVDIPSRYARMSTDALNEFIKSPEGTYSRYVTARQMSGGVSEVVGVVHDAKINALEELIDSLQGNPLFVLFFFRAEGEYLSQRLDAPLLYGGLTATRVASVCGAWNSGSIPILLAQYGSISHGLNLQSSGCSHVAHFNLTDKPDDYDQAIKRIRRQGNSAGIVFNHHILARNCDTDYKVLAGIRESLRQQQELLDALEGVSHATD